MSLQQETTKCHSIPCWEVKSRGSAGMNTLNELLWNWQHWQIKWMKYLFVSYNWVLLRHFTPVPSLMPIAWVQQFHSRMFWCIQVWQLSKLSLKVLFRQLGTKMLKYENKMLIFGQSYIFSTPNVVYFQCDFSRWQHRYLKYMVASQWSCDWTRLLTTEPGAVITFSHFSSQPGTRML